MSDLRKAAQQALDALTAAWQQNPHWQITESMRTLRAALAEPEQPVAWMKVENFIDAEGLWDERVTFNHDGDGKPLYTAPTEEHLKNQGYRQCAEGQKTTQFCGMLEEAVQAEREACAKVCEELRLSRNTDWEIGTLDCAAAIRSRT